MNGAHVLCSDPLAHAVFNSLQAMGLERTNGRIIRVEGIEYGVTAHVVQQLKLVHLVTERLAHPANVRAMVSLEVTNHGYPSMHGASHLMPALMDGLVINDLVHPETHGWRFLPVVPLPACFAHCDLETPGNAAQYKHK